MWPFSKPRRRLFTVHGTARNWRGELQHRVSITLRAANHDDAEELARDGYRVGDAWAAERWLKVDRVVEHRRR